MNDLWREVALRFIRRIELQYAVLGKFLMLRLASLRLCVKLQKLIQEATANVESIS